MLFLGVWGGPNSVMEWVMSHVNRREKKGKVPKCWCFLSSINLFPWKLLPAFHQHG